jgi:glycosyltransferase involved in cell wall biosynthesis
MISLIIPTRKRVKNLKRLIESVNNTASNIENIEYGFYVDDDDEETREFLVEHNVVSGKRILLSEMWNKVYNSASGDILMHCGDDIVFRTPGWDKVVEDTFDQYPDKILFAYGDDLSPSGKRFGTHGFVHRKWIETVGYFVPPYFSSDYNDTWLNAVAEILGRRVFMPIETEHMHFAFGKGEKDQTHIERMARGKEDNIDKIYQNTWKERINDAIRLGEVIDAESKNI